MGSQCSQDSLPARDSYLPQKITGSVMSGIETHDRKSQVWQPLHHRAIVKMTQKIDDRVISVLNA